MLERLYNLQSFYEVVEDVLKKIENYFCYVELEYYGVERFLDEEIKVWLLVFMIVMGYVKIGILVFK